MADSSQKSLVGELNAQKAVVAERIEHVDITNRDQSIGQTAFIAQHIEHVNITNITRGIDELPLATRYDSRVQNFLEYYLGAKDHPAPFGGRASNLAALDAWLDDPAAPPYASLIAPAGRGKSAVLAHWVTRILARSTINDQRQTTNDESVHVVYFPISIRFNTNLETVVFASLAARIAHVFGEKVTYTPDTSQYRGVFSDYLRRTPPNGGRVLVVLDGLDEAAGWEAGADLFPTVAPSHLRVIVAARPLALDKDETAWFNRLGWETPNAAQRISLAGLDREGVRDVLSQMGNPLNTLATKIDLISRLYELSAGDPLLVRLYVEALLPQGAQAAILTPEDLAKLQPGLEAYFKRWFEEQQKLWGSAKPLQDKTVRGLLNLCAAALGPLKKDDVLALAPDIFEDSGLLDEAAQAVNRFIIGDGFNRGYVFSHPRLAEYFAAKLTERERQTWQARFLQYGRDTLTALENKTLLPKNAPAYVVQYYAAHLAHTNAPATDFYALVCESWLRAWEWLEGTPAGFLNDAERAWQQAEAEGPAALGQQIRAALCFASVTSLSSNIPIDLLVACVKAGVISPTTGLVITRQKPNPADRALCLVAIAEFHPSESHAILSEALTAVRAISEEGFRAEVLAGIVPRLPERILGEVLPVVRTISNDGARILIFKALAPRFLKGELVKVLNEKHYASDEIYGGVLRELAARLPEHERVKLIYEEVSAARAIRHDLDRALALSELASLLPKQEQIKVLDEALSLARAIPVDLFRARFLDQIAPGLYRARVLEQIAPGLPEQEQLKMLREQVSEARGIYDDWNRARVLGGLALCLSEHDQEKALEEVLLAVRAISDAYFLQALVPYLPESLLGEALSVTYMISVSHRSFYTENILESLVPRLPESLLAEELSAVSAISDEEYRAYVLKILASRLPENLLGDVLSAARAISNEKHRAFVLNILASRLPESLLAEELSAVSAISDEEDRSYVLKILAPRLPENLLGEALSAARAISDEEHRADVLEKLAPRFSGSLLDESFSAICIISDEKSRTRVLRELAPRLSTSLLGEVLSTVHEISDERFRFQILGALIPHLPESLLEKALSVTRAISDEGSRSQLLVALASRLPESLLDEALSAARAISNEESCDSILLALAPRLPVGEQLKVLKKALLEYRVIYDDDLMELVAQLPEREKLTMLDEALTTVQVISDEVKRINVLAELVPRLDGREQAEALKETLALVRAISDEMKRSKFLAELAPRLPDNLLKEALSLGRESLEEHFFDRVLIELALSLPENRILEALSAARTISHESTRGYILEKLIPRLPESLAMEASLAVSAIVGSLGDPIYKWVFFPERKKVKMFEEALPVLLECEQTEVLREKLSRASAISYGGRSFWDELVPQLPESLLGEALAVARKISPDYIRVEVLNQLTPRLPEDLLGEALAACSEFYDEKDRAEVLSGLAYRLSESLFGEAFSVVRAFSDEENRARVLWELAPRLPESLLGEALRMARTSCHEQGSIAVLSSLATRWSAVCRSTQRTEFEELSATLRAFARTQRPQLLQAIQALLPVIAEQGGVPALRETARAIVDTAKWWP